MGKISGLPDAERIAIIGYLAQDGVIKEITAEVPLRRSDEFQEKYGIKPYIIRSDNKFSNQYRIYLTDPEGAPEKLKEALDTRYQRLNDNEFVRELVDEYGFVFFDKQNSKGILKCVKELSDEQYSAFMSGFNVNNDFISALQDAVSGDELFLPQIELAEEERKKGKGRKKNQIPDSNSSFTDEQLMLLGWAGEEYLYKLLTSADTKIFESFSIDAASVKDIVWYNKGYRQEKDWVDQSVGKGCDIMVSTKNGDYFIEVKSSRRRAPVFAMTSFEMETMKEKRKQYYIAKVDYLENITAGAAPILKVYQDPYETLFKPERMQKAVFYNY